MIPKYCRTFILLLALSIKATAQSPLDTLYANESQNLALFFPDPIQKAVTGHRGFVFTYNRDRAEHLGLLQAVPGKPSNLLVITTKGNLYEFVLLYRKELLHRFLFIDTNNSVGNLNRKNKIRATRTPMSIPVKKIQDTCDSIVGQKSSVLAKTKKRGMHLRWVHLFYQGPAVYMVYEIENRSSIDFDMGYLKTYRMIGTQKRRGVVQQTELEHLYSHGVPTVIKVGEIVRFVLVLPKFVPASTERILIQFGERNGNRELILSHHGSK